MPDTPDQTSKNPKRPKTLGEILGEPSRFTASPNIGSTQARSVPKAIDVDFSPSEYTPYTGQNINPFVTDINKQRAQNQSNWQKLGRSAIQMGTEIAGGSLEGAGYILNIPSMVTDLVKGEQVQLSNSLSELGRELKETTRESFPIYQENPGAFDPTSLGWWAANGVSIVSTLSLAIPAMAAARGLSAGARAIGSVGKALAGMDKAKKGGLLVNALAKKSPQAAKAMEKAMGGGEVLSQAVFSRHAENLMEAVPVFEEKYNEYIEKGLPEHVAKQKAGEAAATIYKANSLFLLQDIGTFTLLKKAVGAKLGGVGPKSGVSWTEGLMEMGGEGLEEAYQYAVAEEASALADISAGIGDPTEFSDRLPNYLNGEMATGAFFGALGSGLFRKVGSTIDAWTRDKNFEQDVANEIQDRENQLGREVTPEEEETIRSQQAKKQARKQTAVENDTLTTNQIYDDGIRTAHKEGRDVSLLFGLKAINNAVGIHASGKDTFREVDRLHDLSDEEFQAELEQAFDGNVPITKQDIADYKDVIDKIPALYDNNRTKYDPEVAALITKKQSEIRLRGLRNTKQESALKVAIQENDTYKQLSKEGKEMVEREIRIRSLKKAAETQRKAGYEESAKWLDDKRKREEKIQNRLKGLEKKPDRQLNDETLMQTLEPDIESLSSDRTSLDISNSAIALTSEKIAKVEKKYAETKKKQKENEQSIILGEEPKHKGVINPEKLIFRQVEDPKAELSEGDRVTTSRTAQIAFDVSIGEDGEVMVTNPNTGIISPIEQLGAHAPIYQVVDPQEAQKESKADLSEAEAIEYEKKIPDSYEGKPPSDESINGKKETIFSAAWKSIHNPKNEHKDDPDDIARSHWAETNVPLKLPNGKSRFYFEFELGDNVNADSGPIKAYLIDRTTGERVIENDREVFFFVHESSFSKTTQGDAKQAIRRFRQEIIDIINAGGTAITPLENKTQGVYRWDGAENDVKTILDNQNPTLAVADSSLNYSDRQGVPQGFNRLGKAKEGQIGRVYALDQALNGEPKALPLERGTLTDDFVAAATAITDALIKGRKPNDTIGDDIRAKLTSPAGQQLLDFLGEPSYIDLLNHIVLEGGITERISDDNSKRFHIDLDAKTLKFGTDGVVSFSEWHQNPDQKSRELAEFLSSRPFNVLRENLNKKEYNDWLLDNKILYQTNRLPRLIQPSLIFGGVYNYKPEQEQVEETGVVTNTFQVGTKLYVIDTRSGQTRLFNELTGEEIDISSKKGREILSNLPKDVINKLSSDTYNKILESLIPEEAQTKGPFSKGDKVIFNPEAKGAQKEDYEGYWIVEDFSEIHYIEEGKSPDPAVFIKREDDDSLNLEVSVYDLLPYIEEKEIDPDQQDLFGEQEDPLSDKNKDDLDDAMGDLLDFQRLPEGPAADVNFTMKSLSKRTGIGYIPVYLPDANWAGVYENGTAFVNLAKAKLDTPFHEFAHPIFRQIKQNSPILYATLTNEIAKDPEYKRTYQRVKQAYPEYDTDQAIEETLVQITGKEAALKASTKGFLSQLWDKIMTYIRGLVGSNVKIDDLGPKTTISDIANLLAGNQFIDIELNPMLAYQLDNSDMSYSEFNSWINSMMFILINDSNLVEYTKAGGLDFNSLKQRLQKIARSNPTADKIINDLFTEKGVNRNSDWYKAIDAKLAKFDIKPEQNLQDEDFDGVESYNYQPNYLFSGKEKTSTFIKMLFSTVPKISDYTKSGVERFELNKFTELPEYHSFNDMWNLASYLLSDIVERTNSDGMVENIFNDFIDKLNSVSHLRPEIKYITKKLQESPEWIQSKFVVNFYKANQNYSLMRYDGKFKLQQSEPSSSESKIASQWRENFNRIFFNANDKIISSKTEAIADRYDKLVDRWAESRDIDKVRDEFTSILRDIGLPATDKGLDKLLASTEKSAEDAFNYWLREEGLNRIIHGQNGVTKVKTNTQKTFIEDQKAAREFIEAEAFFRMELESASTFGPDNNTYHIYSEASIISKMLHYYQNSPEMLDALKRIPYYKTSKWAKHIQNLRITNFYSFREGKSAGIKTQSMGATDRLFADINKTLSGQFSLFARGANATEFNIVGAPVEQSYKVKEGIVSLNTDAVESIADYVYDEIERIRATQQYLDSDNDRLVEGYHTAEKTGLLSFLLPRVAEILPKDKDISRERFKNNDQVKNMIQTGFSNRVKEVLAFIKEQRIPVNKASQLITAQSEKYNKTSAPLLTKLYDYVFNGMVANIEQQKLFAADTAMFATGKNEDNAIVDAVANLQKRILANGSMGLSWYIKPHENEFYNSATINDISYDSKVYENYKGINPADAQAWVTMDLYVEMLKGFGKWNEPLHGPALDRIENGSWRYSDIKLFTQSLKTVHFERVSEDGYILPVYDKQTVFPLIPSLVEGTSLQRLMDNMISKGIDHVTVSSGKKLGRVSPTDAFEEGSLSFKEDIELTPVRQSKKFTMLQTEFPTKRIGSILQGSQQKQNIITDLDPEYTHHGKSVRSLIHTIQNAITDITINKYRESITTDGVTDKDKLYNRLLQLSTGPNANDNMAKYLKRRTPIEAIPAFNYKIQNLLMSEVRKHGAKIHWTNGVSALQVSATGFDSTGVDQGDIVWLSSSKELKPPRFEGGVFKKGQVLLPHSVLQDYNIDLSSKANKDKLIEVLSGFGYRIPGQSISNIAMLEVVGILPEYAGDVIVGYPEFNEQMGADNDGDTVKFLMYNYAGEKFPEKVKYWTDTQGDQTLSQIYEYRTQTLGEELGSKDDFIQKYHDKDILLANSIKGVENYLIDMYEVVFSNEDAFNRATEKLEDNTLEKLIRDHSEYKDTEIEDLQYVSPFFQVQSRDSYIEAKGGVGQDANHIMDHGKSQGKEIYITTDKGTPIKIRGVQTNTIEVDHKGKTIEATLMDERDNVEGVRISKILSMFATAHVDAEKDDYISRGNFNTQTNSVALAMVRAGAPLKDIVNIIGSPIVRYYTGIQRRNKNKLLKNKIDSLEATLEEFGLTEEELYSQDNNELGIYLVFEKISPSIGESIQTTRSSINGAGRSFASAIAYKKLRERAPFITHLANVENKFEEAGGPSMEQKYYESTVIQSEDLYGDHSIAYGDEFHRALDVLYEETNFDYINYMSGDTAAVEDAYFAYYAYVMSGAFSDVDPKSLIVGDNTVAKRIKRYKGKNKLLSEFLIGVRVGAYDFVQTSKAVKVDEDLANQLSEAWADLYKEDPDFALDLGRIAYFQSGYKRNLYSFHEYMPPVVSSALGVDREYNTLEIENTHEAFVDQYIRHSLDNDDIVPPLSKAQDENRKPVFFTRKGNSVIVYSNKRYFNRQGKFINFIKLEHKKDGIEFYKLYELTGITEQGDGIYTPTPSLGYNRKGDRFYEYNLENPTQTPIFNPIKYPDVDDMYTDTENTEGETSPKEDWKEEDNNDQSPLCPN